MKFPYTCQICESRWEATSPNFESSHLVSDEHRNNKARHDRLMLKDSLTDLLAAIHKARTVKAPASHYDEDVYYNGIDFAPQMDVAEKILRLVEQE